jgi:5-methylcytosine-specific restriction endonuclease McrA
MGQFEETDPSLENYWRAIILFGRNVASYKFALARALLATGHNSGEQIKLEELALPFAEEVSRHLRIADKQCISASSSYLEACRSYNREEISREKLQSLTCKLGFQNVIDAFHVVARDEIPIRFFTDERSTDGAIRLTDNFFALKERAQAVDLPIEVEARWRLVETAWELNVNRNLIAVDFDADLGDLIVSNPTRRTTITSCRDALNGYQKGHCFYCFRPISIQGGSPDLADVDHFLPHRLKSTGFGAMIDGVWNLVLACTECNRGANGKFDRIPTTRLLERLHSRNEYLISSAHPLKETLLRQTGKSPPERQKFLQKSWTEARHTLINQWEPPSEGQSDF